MELVFLPEDFNNSWLGGNYAYYQRNLCQWWDFKTWRVMAAFTTLFRKRNCNLWGDVLFFLVSMRTICNFKDPVVTIDFSSQQSKIENLWFHYWLLYWLGVSSRIMSFIQTPPDIHIYSAISSHRLVVYLAIITRIKQHLFTTD